MYTFYFQSILFFICDIIQSNFSAKNDEFDKSQTEK